MRKDYACLGHKTLWLAGVGMKQDKCTECKKLFMRSPEHAYKRDGKFFCSYTCFRKPIHREKAAQVPETPKKDCELEAARALVDRCKEKLNLYSARVNELPKGRQRERAAASAREWRKKLADAQDYMRRVKERGKQNV